MQFERNWIKSLQIGKSLLQSLNNHTEKVDKYDNCQEKKTFCKACRSLTQQSTFELFQTTALFESQTWLSLFPSALCSSTETSLISFNYLFTLLNISAQSYTLFYKNNFIRTTRLKFAQIFRISKEQLRLGFRCKCNCKFLLKNTTRCCMRVTIISCAKLCVVVHF